MSSRAKVEILMSGEWLYGSVNRGEFAKAIAPDAKRTFKFTRWHRRGGASVAIIRGWLVEGWDWETPPVPAKRRAKPHRRAPITVDTLARLIEDLSGIPDETRSMLCIAANVDSVDQLTQATLPAFREALAAHRVGLTVGAEA
jgi:hypothetical protein